MTNDKDYLEALEAAESIWDSLRPLSSSSREIRETPASELIKSSDVAYEEREGVIVDLDDHPKTSALSLDMMPTIDDEMSL